MDEDTEIPMLLELVYGEEAGRMRGSAAPRLMAWCRGFEEWLAERQQKHYPGIRRHSVCAWRRLLRQCPKTPWELAPEDIEGHAAWLLAQGYASKTVYDALATFSNFYRWCGERGVDAECGPDFNPTAGVRRPAIRMGEKLLSLAEVQALLGLLRRDDTPIGRRDYAFFLARLRSGAPLAALRSLRWGQIEAAGGETRVRWRPEAEPQPLPGEAWEAIQTYLAASGRLERMRAESYIFAPLVQYVTETAGSQAEDWREGGPLATNTVHDSLKLYGRLAGIPEKKLRMHVLRSTAIRLQLDAGSSLEEMQVFLDSQVDPRMTRFRLRHMPQLPEGAATKTVARVLGSAAAPAGAGGEGGILASLQISDPANQGNEPRLPVRKAGKLWQPGYGRKHGWYAKVQPVEEVKAILAEDIQGIDEQIVGLRILARGLLQHKRQARGAQVSRLSEAYLLASGQLAKLIQAEDQIAARSGISDFAQRFLQMADEIAADQGDPPYSPEILKSALGGDPELSESARQLVEETAGVRYILRDTFQQAMETEEIDEYARLVWVNGKACMRLLELLKTKGSDSDRLKAYFCELLGEALRDVQEELGIGE